ncbi:unnamed protein product [Chondrus crispus]|uniref:Glycosyltransferase family 32 protein n=1 Tax=Chondrus crispus TaxID=2769 RepID=R7Q604_CHOCR|nr:unnamed protein product [Chondrus crispus]CDF33947.1 unnamed protein product [Chondrus crispus]|eukprot:XP_005713766.1 unnamed protein product [Chondrus crispus]
MSRFAKASPAAPAEKDWQYKLWDNDAVKGLDMLNRALFDAESAPQCQADILRLEVLYEHGGVYVDADIVSTQRDLRPALEAARDTGFMITYEPDTKDKPYSILGNSLIACTPRHPLILMLMSYIKQVYPHKRNHYGVEWVTGPLTYTKVLINPDMPVTVPPSKDFYPAFHYVPNPSAIDLTSFDSYCFQFGYTCSGLSEWVARNNKCKKAHDCNHHANIDYPLGKLKQFPAHVPPRATASEIPKVIHQFSFQGPDKLPERWTSTWSDNFCPANGFQYELWTWDKLKEEIGQFYCANLYAKDHMDAFSVNMLALEVLHRRGGYYVPLTTLFTGEATDPEAANLIFEQQDSATFGLGSIVGCATNSAAGKIKESYQNGYVTSDSHRDAPAHLVSDMRYGDEVASFASFKGTSRFLGASEMYYTPSPESDFGPMSTANSALLWAYDCQVPIFRIPEEKQMIPTLRESGKRAIVITSPEFGVHTSLVKEIPGVMYRLDQEGTEWDFIVINVEWEVDEDGLVVYKAASPFRSPKARYLGFIVNSHASDLVSSSNIETILERHDSGRVFVASEKSTHTSMTAKIFRAMPAITHACQTLAGYEPNFYRDRDEVMDNLLKGHRGDQIGFELQLDDQNRVMFRSWGENGGIDCECKVNPGMSGMAVEFLRIYHDQHVHFETSGAFVR